MKILLPILCLIFSACTIYTTGQGRLPSSAKEGIKIEMMGASNTAGMGASLSFPDRVNEYLKTVPAQEKSALQNKSTFIAFDYFFPTNFSAINDSNQDHLAAAQEIIQKWEEKYDHVIIMKLPSDQDEMSERIQKYIESAGQMNPYKNIIKVLSEDQIASRVQSLNRLIDKMAKDSQKIHSVGFSGIYKYIDRYSYSRRNRAARRKRPRVINPSSLFADPLHLNDLGQAVFFNSIILPKLNGIFASKLPPMKVATFSEEKVREIIRSKLCDSDTFMQQDGCQYWVVLKDPSQYKLKNAKLHIPASYMQDNKSVSLSADKKRRIWNTIDDIETDFARKSTLDVMAIAEIVDGNGESAEKGLMIKVLNNREKVYLDLSKVLFFTTFPIFREQGSDTYSNWGYDHWLSYKYLYTRWSYSGMYTDQSMIGRLKSPAPGTNYKIEVDFDRAAKELKLKWRIYPTVKNQPDEQSRLEYIPEPHLSEVTENQEEYPYVEYELDFKLDDMN
jgi:hypothetical protein